MTNKQELHKRFRQIKAFADEGMKELPKDFANDEIDQIYFELCTIHHFNVKAQPFVFEREEAFIKLYIKKYVTRKQSLQRIFDFECNMQERYKNDKQLRAKLCRPYKDSYKELICDIFRLIHVLSGEDQPVTAKRMFQNIAPIFFTLRIDMTDEEKIEQIEAIDLNPWRDEDFKNSEERKESA